MKKLILSVITVGLLFSCGFSKEKETLSGLKPTDFESTLNGKSTALFTLHNKNNMEVCITNYGARIVSVMVPDKAGKMTDVVLGYDNIADYIASPGNYGALIGRYGNRIANGRFTLDDITYELPKNNNGNSLHGGPEGFHTHIWTARQVNSQTLDLTYLSADGEAGFPGNLDIKVTYTLTEDNAIAIRYEATTDKPTVVNLTNHSYFNLSGIPGSQILNHQILINADTYTPLNEQQIPTGKIASVEGTPMDLRRPTVIGSSIDKPFDQLITGNGYDQNWILNTKGDNNTLAAKAYSPDSGIALEVYTNEPGIQFYTGNFIKGTDVGKHGTLYPKRGALCLETQHYPDSPNQPGFPSTVLCPGEKYISECIYKFKVE